MQVSASGLGHEFQSLLFHNLNFSLFGGDLAAVTGPSGSGKSTLLSILADWTKPTRGAIQRDGIATVTWVPQNPFGVAQRSVLDHAAFALIAEGTPRRDAESAALEVLRGFGLDRRARSRYGDLSGGEAQRLMLARASLSAADLMLVDEPTAQLDPVGALSVIAILQELASAGRIVVIATHDPRVAQVCGQAIRLEPV